MTDRGLTGKNNKPCIYLSKAGAPRAREDVMNGILKWGFDPVTVHKEWDDAISEGLIIRDEDGFYMINKKFQAVPQKSTTSDIGA